MAKGKRGSGGRFTRGTKGPALSAPVTPPATSLSKSAPPAAAMKGGASKALRGGPAATPVMPGKLINSRRSAIPGHMVRGATMGHSGGTKGPNAKYC